MFNLVEARYERASTIVTSNKPFSAWGEIFGDEVVAEAMIDRLVHHAEIPRSRATATGSRQGSRLAAAQRLIGPPVPLRLRASLHRRAYRPKWVTFQPALTSGH